MNVAGVHGTNIAMTCHSDLGKGALDSDTRIPDTDGLITNAKNSYPADIIVWIGPGIKSCHYDVPQERAELFSKDYKECIIIEGGKIFMDLAGIITLQLIGARVRPEKITTHPDCTFCEKDKYFSHRRDKQEIIEANAFIINLK